MIKCIVLSPAQYNYKTAFHPVIGDPLLQKMVMVVEPSWRSRITGEMDGTEVKKELAQMGIKHIPKTFGVAHVMPPPTGKPRRYDSPLKV